MTTPVRTRLAVLGANSFAGCHFVDLAMETDKYEVLGISRSSEKPAEFLPYAHRSRDHFAYRRLDLNEQFDETMNALDEFEPQFIMNFAAQGEASASWSYPADYFQTNCIAFTRLIDHLKGRRYLERFLHMSTAGVYGVPAEAVTERSMLQPASPYAISKAAADMLLLAYFENFGFPGQIVRLPNFYGPYQQLFRIIPKAFVLIKRGEPIELHGGGYAVRSFLHIRDCSTAELAILERGRPGEIYNLSPDDAHSIRDVVALVCDIAGADFVAATRDVEDRRGQESNLRLDSSKIREDLGWEPQVQIRQGIEGVGEWIEREWKSLSNQGLAYVHKR